MSQDGEEVVRKGSFQKTAFSSVKKLTCDEGELTLTPKKLLINCKDFWSRSFPVIDIHLEAWDKNLEVRDSYYGKLLFRLIVDDAEEWAKVFQKIGDEDVLRWWNENEERQKKMPEELNRLVEIKPETLRKIVAEIRKERLIFGEKNIRFILNIQHLIRTTKNRKLKAFILAHCYVAWYEWTKNLLSKIYKGKFGKGPKDDEELIKFLESFPSLGVLDTREWGINANQIRNCIAHERFYYDYRRSELVFTVNKKYKRIRLRELRWRSYSISHTYATLIQSLKQKVQTGKIHYESDF
jgi:hypothetical protein